MKQQQHETTESYYKCFKSNLQTLDMCEMNISDHKFPQESKEKSNPYGDKDKNIQIVQDNFPSTNFIFIRYQQRFNNLLRDLKNDNLKVVYANPDTVNYAIDIMKNYCAAPSEIPSGRHNTRTSSGVHFEQIHGPSTAELHAITPVVGSNGRTIKEYTCFNYGRRVQKTPF